MNNVFNLSVFKPFTCTILLQKMDARFIRGNSKMLLTMAELTNTSSIPTLKIKLLIYDLFQDIQNFDE